MNFSKSKKSELIEEIKELRKKLESSDKNESDLKKEVHRLRRENSIMNEVVDSLPARICWMNNEEKIIGANQTYINHLSKGKKKFDPEGKKVDQLPIPQELADELKELHQEVLKKKKPVEKKVFKERNTVYNRSLYPMKSNRGKVKGFIRFEEKAGSGQRKNTQVSGKLKKDLEKAQHEIKEIEEKRLHQQQDLQRAVDFLSEAGSAFLIGGWEFNVEANMFLWTSEMYRIFDVGLRVKLTMEKTLDFFQADSRKAAMLALDRAVREGTPFDLNVNIITGGKQKRVGRITGKAERKGKKTTRVFGLFQDVSDKAATEGIASQELMKFLNGQDFFSLGIIQDGKIVFANPVTADIIGEKFETFSQWKPQEFLKMVHPDDRDFVAKQVQLKQQGAKNAVRSYTYRLNTGDEQPRYVELYSKSVTYDGKPADLVISKEITKYKKAIADLSEIEKRYNLIAENMGDVIWQVNADGIYTFVSPSVKKLFGYKPSYPIGKHFSDFLHPDSVKILNSFVENVKKKKQNEVKKIYRQELYSKVKGNNYRWIESQVSVLYGDKGRFKGVIGVSRDIQEFKLTRESYEETEKQYREIFESMDHLVFIIKAVGDDYVYSLMNKSIKKYTGLTPEDFIGKTNQEVLGDEVAEIFKQNYDRCRESNSIVIFEQELIFNNKKTYWHTVLKPIREKDGSINSLLGVAQEISSRHYAEEARKKSEQRLRKVIENLPLGTAYIEKNMFSINKKAELITGFSRKDFSTIDDWFTNLYHDNAGKYRQIYQKFQNGPVLQIDDIEIYKKNGEKRIIRINGYRFNSGEVWVIDDVTESVASSNKLEAHRNFMQDIIASAPNLMLQMDAVRDQKGEVVDFVFKVVNKWSKFLLNRPPEELINKRMIQEYPGTLETGAFGKYKSTVDTGKPVQFELYYNYEGLDIWFDLQAVKFGDGILLMARDFSDYKRNEQKLHQLSKVFMNAADPIILQKADTTIFNLNKAAVKAYGWSREELIGEKYIKLIPPELTEEVDALFEKCLKGETISNYELTRLRKDGSTTKILLTLFLIDDPNNQERAVASIAKQIDDLKEAEEALREEKERAQLYFNIAEIMLLVLDVNANVVTINQHGCKLLGYSYEEIVGKNWIENFIPNETTSKMLQIFDAYVNGRACNTEGFDEDYFGINPIVRKDGEKKFISWQNSAITDQQGRITGVISSGQDLTERIQAEDKLAASEKKYRALYQSSQDAFAMTTLDGNYIEVNQKFCELLGYTEEELLKMNFVDVVDPEFAAQRSEIVDKLLQKGHIPPYEREYIRKDGTRVTTEVRSHLLSDKDNARYAWAFISDISERKEWERQLLEKDEILVQAQRIGKIGSFNHDLVKNKSFWSDEMLSIFGLQKIDVDPDIRKMIEKFIHPEDKPRIMQLFKEVFTELKPDRTEFRIIRADGEAKTVWAGWNFLFDEKNNPIRLLGAVQDISEQKDLERALYTQNRELADAKIELEQTNKELQQFTYVVSHDLKTPLRAIRNYKDFLDEDLKKELDGEVKTYFDGIGKAVTEAEMLVDDLLTLSRVGRKSPGVEHIHLKQFIDGIISHIAKSKNAEITTDIPADLECKTDPLALRQIITNLVTNGLKFNKSTLKKVHLKGDKTGGKILLQCIDNGIGIDPKYKKQIFEIFERLHLKEEYDGTGVGLAIVKKAVEYLGGEITLDSVIDEGTTMTVSLPCTKGDESE